MTQKLKLLGIARGLRHFVRHQQTVHLFIAPVSNIRPTYGVAVGIYCRAQPTPVIAFQQAMNDIAVPFADGELNRFIIPELCMIEIGGSGNQ